MKNFREKSLLTLVLLLFILVLLSACEFGGKTKTTPAWGRAQTPELATTPSAVGNYKPANTQFIDRVFEHTLNIELRKARDTDAARNAVKTDIERLRKDPAILQKIDKDAEELLNANAYTYAKNSDLLKSTN